MAPDFECAAYGPEGADFGALCFVSGDPGKRVCAGLGECRRVMAAERQRVWCRIQELAARGDETAAYLAEEFARPEQLLGGSGQEDEQEDEQDQ
jgi:hypothetical protein